MRVGIRFEDRPSAEGLRTLAGMASPARQTFVASARSAGALDSPLGFDRGHWTVLVISFSVPDSVITRPVLLDRLQNSLGLVEFIQASHRDQEFLVVEFKQDAIHGSPSSFNGLEPLALICTPESGINGTALSS